MLDDVQKLPDDPSVLKGLLASLASELKVRDILIEKLKHQLVGLRRHQFGSRSKRGDLIKACPREGGGDLVGRPGGVSVFEALGARPVRVAVGGGRQACDRGGATFDAVGRD